MKRSSSQVLLNRDRHIEMMEQHFWPGLRIDSEEFPALLAQLPEQLRFVFEKRFLKNPLSRKEVANQLGISPSKVDSLEWKAWEELAALRVEPRLPKTYVTDRQFVSKAKKLNFDKGVAVRCWNTILRCSSAATLKIEVDNVYAVYIEDLKELASTGEALRFPDFGRGMLRVLQAVISEL